MSNWTITKKRYVNIHDQKDLAQPNRRLNALDAIENTLRKEYPELLSDQQLFKNLGEDDFIAKYYQAKGKSLSGAEKSVIKGLYNLAI